MKYAIRRIGVFLLMMVVLLQTVPVYAANSGTLTMKLDSQENKTVKVSCYVTGGSNITNGKMQFTYNGNQIKLAASEKGDALHNTLLEKNDVLTGLKDEGEIIITFAGSSAINDTGSIIDFTFNVQDSVSKDDKIEINVNPEYLSGDGGDVAITHQNLILTMQSDNTVVGENVEGTTDGNTGNTGTSDTAGTSTDKSNASTGTDSAKSGTASTATTAKDSVGTGDNTNIWIPIVILIAALIVIIILMVIRIRRNRK